MKNNGKNVIVLLKDEYFKDSEEEEKKQEAEKAKSADIWTGVQEGKKEKEKRRE